MYHSRSTDLVISRVSVSLENAFELSQEPLASNDAGDGTYTSIEGQIQSLTGQRDALASQMKALLEGAEFNGQPFSDGAAQSLIAQGQSLLDQANTLGQ
jgi:hypothetical protein